MARAKVNRVVDPVAHFKSVEQFLADEKAKHEQPHTLRSPVSKIGDDQIRHVDPGGGQLTQLFIENISPGMEAYTRRVIEALDRKDKAREWNEIEEAPSPSPSRPIATTRL